MFAVFSSLFGTEIYRGAISHRGAVIRALVSPWNSVNCEWKKTAPDIRQIDHAFNAIALRQTQKDRKGGSELGSEGACNWMR